MNTLKQVCDEILQQLELQQLEDGNAGSQRQLNKIKLKALNKYKANHKAHKAEGNSYFPSHIPKNADIYFSASEEDRERFKGLLSLKPVRTISGVAPIATMSEPYPCPHTMKGIGPCSYCPGGPGSVFGDVPQSYTGKEPSTRRAIRNNYDPYLIVFNRLEHYVAMGKIPDKAELIVQGGTFTFFPRAYQEYFVKYSLKAMNDFSRLFFGIDGNLDILKFKKFFELPRILSDEDKRTAIVQNKLMRIKNLDLGDFEAKKKIDELFFDGINKKEEKPGSQKQAFEPQVSSHPFIYEVNNSVYKSFDWVEPGWQKQALRLPQEQVGSHPSGFKTSIVEVPAPAPNKIDNSNILAIKNVNNKLKTENNYNIPLKQIQKENETSFIRCVGLTIETKSDFGKLYHGNLMLELGCTRVEIGIQSIYDDVLKATSRGNTVSDNIESLRILKDLGFKINCHYMPGLPNTTKEMDLHGLRQLFEPPDYMPDMLKIYPCMVMEGTRLYDDWKTGKFTPLTTQQAAEIIAEAKRHIPEWCRVMRVQRDIPTYVTSSGVDRTNLRQYVEKICKEKGIKCRCIRCREAGLNQIKNNKIGMENIKIKIMEYKASKGREFFIEAEDTENDILFGYCRLRFPSQFLRQEITENSALVRELHVYSAAVQIGKKSNDSFQHRGIGKQLMAKAEEIANQHGKNKVVVLAGIGARQYFTKLGYEHDGCYMSKKYLNSL